MTQSQKVLKALEDANGAWVSGTYFLRVLYLSQYHARLWELQNKGVNIEVSDFTDDHNFKSYRIPVEQPTLELMGIALPIRKPFSYEGV